MFSHVFLFWHFLLWRWSVVSRPFKIVVETNIFLVPVYHSPTKLFRPKLHGLCSKVVSYLPNINIKSLPAKTYRTMSGLHVLHSTIAHWHKNQLWRLPYVFFEIGCVWVVWDRLWKTCCIEALREGEKCLNIMVDTRRERQKARALATPTPTDSANVCGSCHRICRSRIGLQSHRRKCLKKWTNSY